MYLLFLHVIASPKGVAISFFLGLLRRFTPRNDKLFGVCINSLPIFFPLDGGDYSPHPLPIDGGGLALWSMFNYSTG